MILKYILVGLLAIIMSGCFSGDKKEEIKIGFVAGLSGKYSILGKGVQNGVMLAFDEINYKIGNQKVNILFKDDKQDKNEAKKIINNFVKNNIKVVIGNATSSMTAISLPVINKQKGSLLISATASSNDFTGKDDNFLRVQVDNSEKRYSKLFDYIKNNNYDKIFFIYDGKNKSYAKGYSKLLQNMIIKSGGKKFVANVDINQPYKNIIDKLKNVDNNMIFLVANSIDSAQLIQRIRNEKINTHIMITGWAKTSEFIENGGKAINGVTVSTGYDENSQEKGFLDFKNEYVSKFNAQPSDAAVQGYKLAQILIKNLKISSDMTTLKDRILKMKTYKGFQWDINFDKYGDINRDYFIMKVDNARFIRGKE